MPRVKYDHSYLPDLSETNQVEKFGTIIVYLSRYTLLPNFKVWGILLRTIFNRQLPSETHQRRIAKDFRWKKFRDFFVEITRTIEKTSICGGKGDLNQYHMLFREVRKAIVQNKTHKIEKFTALKRVKGYLPFTPAPKWTVSIDIIS